MVLQMIILRQEKEEKQEISHPGETRLSNQILTKAKHQKTAGRSSFKMTKMIPQKMKNRKTQKKKTNESYIGEEHFDSKFVTKNEIQADLRAISLKEIITSLQKDTLIVKMKTKSRY